MKNNKFILLIIIFIVAIVLIARFSYSLTPNIESDEYEIKNNIIYAVPTTYDYKVAELLSKLKSTDVEIYNSNNQLLNMNDNVGTGYKLKVSNSIYDIVVLGDITGDGLIQIGDIAALYNHYKSNKTIDGLRLESGKLTNNNSVTLGDVAKLYNYYKGHKAFSYYSYSNDILSEDEIESLTLKRVNEIRNTNNTDFSHRDQSKIFYVSSDGNDSNDGLSEEKPLKTLSTVNYKMNTGSIPNGSTILFRDGDTFTGTLILNRDDILFGSYGDISLGKPTLSRSEYDGKKDGEWVNVKGNIWKYTINGSDQVFNKNVGTIWFFCNEGNNNCSKSMSSLDKKFEYAQMITTNLDYDETNIIDNIDTILTNDLEFYHVGHPYNAKTTGKELYLYSIGNPAERYDEIKFNQSGHNIVINGHNNIYVDNLKLIHTGSHGVGGGTMSNLVVTNCEIGFVGGIVQNYNNNKPTRYGNAIEIYGSVMDKDNYSVDDGFIVDNNYIYQCYDAGPTFQLSADGLAHMEKARFSNNVLEYNNYNIEYWNYSRTTSGEIYDNSYIQNFVIENNIMRYAGHGISQTRPDKGQSAHIKTWNHDDGAYNVIKGNISIRNNIFYKQSEQAYFWKTNGEKFPVLANNVFYGMYGDSFGYSSHTSLSNKIKFNDVLLEENYPTNRFTIINKPLLDIRDDSGISNEVNWNYDASTYTLSISGNGRMADYSEDNMPPWYKYVDYIYNINIGEGITYIGHYAFANLYYVSTFRIDAANLSDLTVSSENVNYGANYSTYEMGISTNGTTVIIGKNVTRLPKMLFKPAKNYSGNSYYTNVIFEGNKVTNLMNYSLAFYQGEALAIPEGVKNAYGLSLGYSKEKILILPNTLKSVSDWAMNGDTMMEKLVYGQEVNTMYGYTLGSATSLKTLVINHINNPETVYATTLNGATQTIDVYGDETTETWVNKQISECGKTNLIYHNISEYKSSITSNSNINGNVGFNGSYTFESNKNVKIYYRYVDSSNKEILFDGVDYTKNGNTYTINNIRNDIYIEVE
ncbi:MAG: hypothetical protein E7159_02650 [Firmicutes bacterium]|nr:hypothetical protein [Bacillota bacterium]